MSVKQKGYRRSPSAIENCQRQMVYLILGYPQEERPASELRAMRGEAIHQRFAEMFPLMVKSCPELADIQSVKVIDHESVLDIPWGDTGQADLVAEIMLIDGTREHIIVDLKCYSQIPQEPYESSVSQIQAYILAAEKKYNVPINRGLVVYFSDMGKVGPFWIPRRADINEYAEGRFKYAEESAARREFPLRLPYGSKVCSFCPFESECWGRLADEIEAMNNTSQGPCIPDKSFGERLLVMKNIRNQKNDLVKRESALSRACVDEFSKLGASKVTYEGQTFTLSRVTVKGKTPYYKINIED